MLLLQDFLDSHCIKVSALKLSLKNTKNKTTTKNTKNKTPKFNPAFADNNIRNEWGLSINREQSELATVLRTIRLDSETPSKEIMCTTYFYEILSFEEKECTGHYSTFIYSVNIEHILVCLAAG